MATTPEPDLIDLNRRAAAQFERLVAGLSAADLAGSTPCPEWDVRTLLNHVIGGGAWLGSILEGAPPAEVADALGDDPLASYRATQARFDAALSAPGALERTCTMPWGEMPGAALAVLRFGENLLHGWDLAKATGQPLPFDADLYEQALLLTPPLYDSTPRSSESFLEPVPVAADASAADRFAAYTGRQP